MTPRGVKSRSTIPFSARWGTVCIRSLNAIRIWSAQSGLTQDESLYCFAVTQKPFCDCAVTMQAIWVRKSYAQDAALVVLGHGALCRSRLEAARATGCRWRCQTWQTECMKDVVANKDDWKDSPGREGRSIGQATNWQFIKLLTPLHVATSEETAYRLAPLSDSRQGWTWIF